MKFLTAFLFIIIGIWARELQIRYPEVLYENKESYFFRPAVANSEYAVFGYLGKVKPTRQEVEEQRKRLQAIIRGTIEQEYGSWENYQKVTQQLGEKAAKKIAQEAPAILPSSIVEKAVPLLLQGALYFAMHSGMSSEPIGNVGKTGIIVIDKNGRIRRIQLAINEPVEYIELHPTKPLAVVLCDASYEENYRYHTVGHILLVDIQRGTVQKEWLFANATDQVEFTPNDKIAFIVQNPKKWSERALRFIDMQSGKLLQKSLYPMAKGSYIEKRGVLFFPKRFEFWHDLLIVAAPKGWDIYQYPALEFIGRIFSGKQFLAIAKHHPWLFNDRGCVRDIQKVQRLVCVEPMEDFRSGICLDNDKKLPQPI